MATKFKTVEDVKKAFRTVAAGADTLPRHGGFRYGDIDKHSAVLEEILDSDYNKISGFSRSEIFEAVSHLQTQFGTNAYLSDCRANRVPVSESLYEGVTLSECEDNYYSVCEAFEATTAQQAPYPVPSISFVTYRYEKTVLPFLCHLFDLRGNRGLVYFQKITAVNSLGTIEKGDELGRAGRMPAQPNAFATTHIVNEEIGELNDGVAEYEFELKFVPHPGTLIVTLDGHTGYFQDFQAEKAQDNKGILTPVGEALGFATVEYPTEAEQAAGKKAKVKINLAVAGAAGLKVRADYNRDVETHQGGVERQARFTMSVEAEHIVTENISIFTETNLYQEALSRAIFGLDWNDEVDRAMAMIYNKEMANKVITEIREKIPATNLLTHDITSTLALPGGTATGTGDNKIFNVQFLAIVMGALNKVINKSSGIDARRFTTFVVNIDVLPIFEGMDKYTQTTVDQEDQMGGMFLAGTYDGIPVVAGYDPIIPEGEVIGLFKSKSQDFLTPYVLGTFMDPVIRDIYDQDNLAINKKQMIATIGGKNMAPQLTGKLTIAGINDLLGI